MQNIKELPLFSDLQHRYSIDLEQKTFTIDFKWKSRTKNWYLSIEDQNQLPVITEYKLVAAYPMMIDYALQEFGLTGYFVLLDKGDFPTNSLNKTPKALKNNYRLFYIHNEE